ncbi:MAG: DUF6080 domain-containing protein [Prevotella sp.]|jgi:hypothetical protein
MKKILQLFSVSRREWRVMLPVLVVVVAVNLLVIFYYWHLFSQPSHNVWGPFPSNFHVSGYDALIYSMSSQWNIFYNICFRHPLLAYFLLPTWAVTRLLLWLTGYNFVQWVLGVQLVACAFYGFLFFYRLLHEVLQLAWLEAASLTWLLLSFGMVLVSTAVPDHFIFSFFLLLLTLYLAGKNIQSRQPMSTATTFWLFLLTAGVTLTNGVKTFLAQWVVNGRSVFRPRNLLVWVFGALLLYGVGKASYEWVVKPDIETRTNQLEKARAKQAAKTTHRKVAKAHATTGADDVSNSLKSELPFLQWVDTKTPRWQSFRENFMGETLILHRDHLLQDVGMGRPTIVTYRSWVPYAIEGGLLLLAVLGYIVALHERLTWLALSWLAFDGVIHFVFGFGLNEVYIMACHWVFILPLMIGFLMSRLLPQLRRVLTSCLLVLAGTLLFYHLFLLICYFT